MPEATLTQADARTRDLEALEELNQNYIRSVRRTWRRTS